MGLNIKVNGKTIKFKAKANISGLMVDNIKVNGKIVLCMDLEFTLNLIISSLQEIIQMIKSMDTEYLNGKTDESIKVGGCQENSLVLENIKVIKRSNLVYGKMGNQ